MKIAIQAADLDAPRIDGTRVYILNLLKYFGQLDPSSQFLIYHKNEFNPELTPANFPNYKIIKKSQPYLWTQTRFARAMWKDKPDVLWMPLHNMPVLIRGKIKTVVTIHDLAFKYFPETFTAVDLFKINMLTRLALMFADKIITISQSSKRDILKFYPGVDEKDIKVIYHGFDGEVYNQERNREKEEEIKMKYGITEETQNSKLKSQSHSSNLEIDYLLYIGAIQPRKNLVVLIDAFEKIKKENLSNLKLVLVGEKAWLSEGLFEKIEKSPWKNDIITSGRIDFEPLGHLLRGARAFVFPSLYEGFGIPILEAFASRVPVICSKNSSLPEVGGDAAIYFEDNDAEDLAKKIKDVISDEDLRQIHIAKGLEQIKKFSWEKCARETLDYLKS